MGGLWACQAGGSHGGRGSQDSRIDAPDGGGAITDIFPMHCLWLSEFGQPSRQFYK